MDLEGVSVCLLPHLLNQSLSTVCEKTNCPVFVMLYTILVYQTRLSLSRHFFCVCVVRLQASRAQSCCVASVMEGQSRVHQPSVQGRTEPDSGCSETQHHPLLLQVSNCNKQTQRPHKTVVCHRKLKPFILTHKHNYTVLNLVM